jgi:hypothetical protein
MKEEISALQQWAAARARKANSPDEREPVMAEYFILVQPI